MTVVMTGRALMMMIIGIVNWFHAVPRSVGGSLESYFENIASA